MFLIHLRRLTLLQEMDYNQTFQKFCCFFKLGFIPCKAEQPLRGMESQEKEAQKD